MMRQVVITTAVLGLAACANAPRESVSSINYLQEKISSQCAYDAIRDADGFAVKVPLNKRGMANQFTAFFNSDMPVQIVVRLLADDTAEVSAYVRLQTDATPLDRREASFAVRTVDETIYRACTQDGKTFGGNAGITIETKEKE